ncbi:hypothetical protein CcaverHIS002_0702970 [Cutaneotrichosporon cavernicola]|uniref:Uncharacterized protein n=1 Tax=Cutaneotrichosporon cavernicola TaxID=279322 RepID=A0AA48QYJ0_9TREE|nr:uncharacterized protein CcaverHIS019_0703050 [Cutaneotrichosporon cavernicola]BEI86951.1 hypothetical protein CcaverHIS002_0702970 [Cutaneotrichosporon cavernicola]BEI94724.1 hypothetical protein CcaverHIS019_0703050 [Cutaneotrichosporon cavernicola]BEJ02499.1 hypothetical protein CcaverHIS631_0702940 [Cutaneotrichosporon cavernicola]BEJ10257.1 hypothetical protein CcaverHIS641_0702920 [Cutaneotrichosporon cavernicola]
MLDCNVTTLDCNAYPHIVDAIANAAAAQRETALAMRPVCREFRAKADAALARHLRIDCVPYDYSSGLDYLDSLQDPPLLVLTASGNRIPRLYPSSAPPAGRGRPYAPPKWPALIEVLAYTRFADILASPGRSQTRELRQFRNDTVRCIGVNGSRFESDIRCRRLVSLTVIGSHDPNFADMLPTGSAVIGDERFVINVVVPDVGPFHIGTWRALPFYPRYGVTLILRPVDSRLQFGEIHPQNRQGLPIGVFDRHSEPRHESPLGVLGNVGVMVLSADPSTKFTLVGIENLSWERIGVPEPENEEGCSKEAWFIAALKESIVPAYGPEMADTKIDEVMSCIEFLSDAEYRTRVGEEEYESDMVPLDGLLDKLLLRG